MKKFVLLTLLLIPVIIAAQEITTLTTPIAKPSTTTFHVSRITLDIDALVITVQLTGNNGEQLAKTYDSTTVPTSSTLLHQLNIGNFSVNSLMKAVYNRLIADGVITGTVSGVPQ